MGKTITKEEIALFEIEEFQGRIWEIQREEDVDAAVQCLSEYKFLGFDSETKPSFKKGKANEVALIQLATNDLCVLFRLNKIGFPKPLIELLSNPDISKIGLSLRDDFMSIRRKVKFTPEGFIDLQKIVPNHEISELSLQKVYALLFQKKISKSQRLSNWEADCLTESQKKYAALDAWACLKIYERLC